MKPKVLLAITACGVCACQHAPRDVRAELDRREREWRGAIATGYDLPALTAFIVEMAAKEKIVAGLDVSAKKLAADWSIGGATMMSGDWYFNAWEPASNRFSIHTHFWSEKKRLQFKCERLSRTNFKVLETVVEVMREELIP